MLIIHYRGGIEGSLEAGMATQSSILACRIPWTDAPGESTVHRVTESETTECLAHTHAHTRFKQTERQVPFIPSDGGGLEEKGGK